MKDDIDGDILADILNYAGPPNRKPGDVDVAQIVKITGKGSYTARNIMERLAQTGDYDLIDVYDPEVGAVKKVIRRVTPEPG